MDSDVHEPTRPAPPGAADPARGRAKTPADPLECSFPGITPAQELIDNLPYLLMIVLGAAIFALGPGGAAWRWPLAAAYAVYGVLGALWIMLFVCPYCHFFATRLCPCGYGRIAPRLRRRQAGSEFARQFRRHIPVIVPLWFLPPIAAGIALIQHFTWLMTVLAVVFVVNGFVVLPLLSRMYGCKQCPQKETCPWMGGCKKARQSSRA